MLYTMKWTARFIVTVLINLCICQSKENNSSKRRSLPANPDNEFALHGSDKLEPQIVGKFFYCQCFLMYGNLLKSLKLIDTNKPCPKVLELSHVYCVSGYFHSCWLVQPGSGLLILFVNGIIGWFYVLLLLLLI